MVFSFAIVLAFHFPLFVLFCFFSISPQFMFSTTYVNLVCIVSFLDTILYCTPPNHTPVFTTSNDLSNSLPLFYFPVVTALVEHIIISLYPHSLCIQYYFQILCSQRRVSNFRLSKECKKSADLLQLISRRNLCDDLLLCLVFYSPRAYPLPVLNFRSPSRMIKNKRISEHNQESRLYDGEGCESSQVKLV